jgi:uncharacterized SAM-binding protein YcdF (DUF218 family)
MLYHFASKVFSPLLEPGNLLLFMLIIGLVLMWTKWARSGRYFVATATFCFLLLAIVPFGSWLLIPLENRFPPFTSELAKVDGIIVLGGASQNQLSATRGQPSLNGNAERLTAFVTLARRFPSARLVFTGGSSSLAGSVVSEADIAEEVFRDLGLNTDRVYFERHARNTLENAQKTFPVVAPKPEEVWLLVTSARHMPRAMGVFRQARWPVRAFPVDYRSGGTFKFRLRLNLRSGLTSLSVGLREWTALVIYRMLNRTTHLFPKP